MMGTGLRMNQTQFLLSSLIDYVDLGISFFLSSSFILFCEKWSVTVGAFGSDVSDCLLFLFQFLWMFRLLTVKSLLDCLLAEPLVERRRWEGGRDRSYQCSYDNNVYHHYNQNHFHHCRYYLYKRLTGLYKKPRERERKQIVKSHWFVIGCSSSQETNWRVTLRPEQIVSQVQKHCGNYSWWQFGVKSPS